MIKSRDFPAPFVRVRGRLFRKAARVTWSLALRTYKEPLPEMEMPAGDRHDFWVACLSEAGEVVSAGRTVPEFFAKDQASATFVCRLPYHKATRRLALMFGEELVGHRDVPAAAPAFVLISPTRQADVDGEGKLELRWRLEPKEQPGPVRHFVRYSHDQHRFIRPTVNLRAVRAQLDLAEMPGGRACVAQVLATNGYQTSYVETPAFRVPKKPPDILVGDVSGPVLFAQGFSLEAWEPLIDDSIVWFADDTECGRGGTLDVRRTIAGRQEIKVVVTDQYGDTAERVLGTYDSRTGRAAAGLPGL